ncbi:putative glutaredoxin-like, plant II, thioredoxin-like protein [Lupinus albus]|uniref:Putative glutaredoxin-like, plant II, thioredoxin-like protein n=1 Tax=Lupinus albus TaxID=3870 RepID=A0A6A4N4C9_LUPAL|nr:putative glutaredoxin-like, plant II, thioredoxin-like protein [Lupinus albus]
MQQAIPYRSWRSLHNPLNTNFQSSIDDNSNNNNNSNKNSSTLTSEEMVLNMVSENAVIVFGRCGCCMSHVVKRLLQGLGANPAVYEVEEKDEVDFVRELEAIVGKNNIGNDGKEIKVVQFPVVFIGGKLFGGLDLLMATHISGELVPMLKQVGALWL